MSAPNGIFHEMLRNNWSKLSPTDQRLADYLLRSYPRFLFQTASEIARELGTSISTVTRFFPKIGFKNIREAYSALREQANFVVDSPLDRYRQRHLRAPGTDILFEETLETDLSNLQNTFASLDNSAVQRFIKLISDSKRTIYILGSRKVFALAYYLFIQLAAVRNRVSLVRTDNFFMVETVLETTSNDVLIIFDFRRYPRVHLQTAEQCKEQGATLIGIVDSQLAPVAQLADLVFKVETRSVSAFDSYTSAVSLINALIAGLVKHFGENARKRYERMEQVYRHFDVWSWQGPIARKFVKASK
ncbi:MAG: MurR/RpiR family transcriptional regulator [Deltaproteobacteria bacterium]|nr:MurR/RpiR family transcriptional regulator [Deltaproteobacteria bacterium]